MDGEDPRTLVRSAAAWALGTFRRNLLAFVAEVGGLIGTDRYDLGSVAGRKRFRVLRQDRKLTIRRAAATWVAERDVCGVTYHLT